MVERPHPFRPFAAQRRQADAGGIETAVDGEDLSGDVAGTIAAQEEDRFRQFLLEAVAIERNGVVIVGADFRRMHLLRHRGFDRAGRHRVDANAERSQFDRELFCEMREPGLAGAVGRAQRRGAHRRDRRDVDDRAAAMLAHQRRRRLGADKRPGEVDLQDAAPVFIRGVEQRREHRDAGIVDQRVEPAEACAHRRHGVRHRVGIGDVAMQFQRVVRIGEPATAPRSNSPSMSSSATRQPSARNRLAVASPMPRAAPVTRAIFCGGGGHGRVRWREKDFPLL